jgi:AraC-like DNA-binding protein
VYKAEKDTRPLVSKTLLLRQLGGLRALGYDVVKPLARVNLSVEDIETLPELVPLAYLRDIWSGIVEETGESGIGLRLAEQVRPEMFEVFGYVITSSATLGDALLRATLFVRLVSESQEISFYVDGERAVLTVKPMYPDLIHPESMEFIVGAIGIVGRQITGQQLSAIEARFTHAEPTDLTHHHRLFPCPVLFGQPHNGFVISSSLLHTPVISHDSRLCAELEAQAEQMLSKLPRAGDLSRKVQELISAELRGGNPSADNVAERLSMHPKTLSRRLKSEGTSHQQLLDQLRYQLAERYLRRPNMSIGEVAFLLGYSDTSSFNKAFKRWTGAAPQAYRQRALSTP